MPGSICRRSHAACAWHATKGQLKSVPLPCTPWTNLHPPVSLGTVALCAMKHLGTAHTQQCCLLGMAAYLPLSCLELNLSPTPASLRPRGMDGCSDTDLRLTSIPRWQKDNLTKNLALVEEVQCIAAEKGCTPGQLALAWLLHQGPDVFPIPGKVSALTGSIDQAALAFAAANVMATLPAILLRFEPKHVSTAEACMHGNQPCCPGAVQVQCEKCSKAMDMECLAHTFRQVLTLEAG